MSCLISFLLCTFNRFPVKQPDRLQKWVLATKRSKWLPKATDYLCSRHFKDGCFLHYGMQVRLRDETVPTIFDFPEHLQQPIKPQRRHIIKHIPASVQLDPGLNEQSTATSDTSTASVSLAHHSYCINVSPRGIKRKYEGLLESEK